MLKTARLLLRPWKEEDLEPFARLNADPRVMEFFPKTLSRAESDRLAKSFSTFIETHGWGFWAVSAPGLHPFRRPTPSDDPPLPTTHPFRRCVVGGPDLSPFIGFIGLAPVRFAAPFTPATEIGWRLAHEYWGKGFATEGALAALRYGFETLRLPEIISFTAAANLRSRRVMERLGMTHNPADDFDHPNLPEGHPLRQHVLYRIQNPAAKFSL